MKKNKIKTQEGETKINNINVEKERKGEIEKELKIQDCFIRAITYSMESFVKEHLQEYQEFKKGIEEGTVNTIDAVGDITYSPAEYYPTATENYIKDNEAIIDYNIQVYLGRKYWQMISSRKDINTKAKKGEN